MLLYLALVQCVGAVNPKAYGTGRPFFLNAIQVSRYTGFLEVDTDDETKCNRVATEMNNLNYGTRSLDEIVCVNHKDKLTLGVLCDDADALNSLETCENEECPKVARALNTLTSHMQLSEAKEDTITCKGSLLYFNAPLVVEDDDNSELVEERKKVAEVLNSLLYNQVRSNKVLDSMAAEADIVSSAMMTHFLGAYAGLKPIVLTWSWGLGAGSNESECTAVANALNKLNTCGKYCTLDKIICDADGSLIVDTSSIACSDSCSSDDFSEPCSASGTPCQTYTPGCAAVVDSLSKLAGQKSLSAHGFECYNDYLKAWDNTDANVLNYLLFDQAKSEDASSMPWATKTDLDGMATKTDLAGMATKVDLDLQTAKIEALPTTELFNLQAAKIDELARAVAALPPLLEECTAARRARADAALNPQFNLDDRAVLNPQGDPSGTGNAMGGSVMNGGVIAGIVIGTLLGVCVKLMRQ